MKQPRKPKIGLVGMMAQPFRGDKEGYFKGDSQKLYDLAIDWDFELKVIPDGIYNLEESESASKALADWGADCVLLQSSSFASGDFIRPFASRHSQLGLWGVPEGPPSREGGLPLNSFTGVNLYNSLLKNYYGTSTGRVKWFFGRPGDTLFLERFRITVAALRGAINLKEAHIGLIGGVAPGFNNLIVDPRIYEQKLGIRIQSLELDVILEKARALGDDPAVNQRAEAFIQPGVTLAEGNRAHLLELARLQIAIESLVDEFGFDALALSCWPRFQEEPGVAVCSLLGQLNTLGMITSCEGDVPSAVAMLGLRHLSNSAPVTLMDLVSVDTSDETALLWHCGPTSPLMADESGVSMESLWLFDGENGTRKGLHNDLQLKPGEVTIMGLTPALDGMLVVSGRIDNQKPSYKGSRGWLADLRINTIPVGVPDLVETLMASGYQHHYPLVYGELAEACLEIAALLGIPPIQKRDYAAFLKG